MSKQALKNKKKRDAKKASKGSDADGPSQEEPKLPIAANRNKLTLSLSGGDTEMDKKVKGIAKVCILFTCFILFFYLLF